MICYLLFDQIPEYGTAQFPGHGAGGRRSGALHHLVAVAYLLGLLGLTAGHLVGDSGADRCGNGRGHSRDNSLGKLAEQAATLGGLLLGLLDRKSVV